MSHQAAVTSELSQAVKQIVVPASSGSSGGEDDDEVEDGEPSSCASQSSSSSTPTPATRHHSSVKKDHHGIEVTAAKATAAGLTKESTSPTRLISSSSSSSSVAVAAAVASNGRARGATYDGNLCMICSDRASGFHYGVLACEGCKGFFKHVCKEQLKQVASGDESNNTKDGGQQSSKRHCVFGGNCEINMRTRNRCQYCRIQKCLELGMSKDGIKLGRRSKKFKQNLSHVIAAAAAATTSKSPTAPMQTPQSSQKSPVNTAPHQQQQQSSSKNAAVESQQQQILAILPDNKYIIKAIDILSAVSAVAATASTTTTATTAAPLSSPSTESSTSQPQLVLANNLNILNSSSNNINNHNAVDSNVTNSLTGAQLLAAQQLALVNATGNKTAAAIIGAHPTAASIDANNNFKVVKIEQNGNFIDQASNNDNVIVLSNDQMKTSSFSSSTNVNGGTAAAALSTQAPIIVLNSFNLTAASPVSANPSSNLVNSFVILNNAASELTPTLPQPQQQQENSVNYNKPGKLGIYSMLDKAPINTILEAIVQAHKDTDTMYNHEPNLSALLSSTSASASVSASNGDVLKAILAGGLIAVLTRTRLLDHINMLIEHAVLFAKNVPYFMNIHESDRIALLKSCIFDVICVRHSVFFRRLTPPCNAPPPLPSMTSTTTAGVSPFITTSSSSRTRSSSDAASSASNIATDTNLDLATLAACAVAASTSTASSSSTNGHGQVQGRLLIPFWNVWLTQDTLTQSLPQLACFINMLFDFFAYFNSMNPNEFELAIFTSYLLFNTDDQTLNDKENIKSYQSLFHDIVINEFLKTRPEQPEQTATSSSKSRNELVLWLKTCCVKLKRLNEEHARILTEHKQFIQFPDLYAELYNL